MNIFIIPGNPPVKYFYDIWKQELEENFKEDNLQITVEYFPSFDLSLDSKVYYEKMITFYTDMLFHTLKNKPESKKVVLIGHSVGGAIALEILKRHHDIIDKCVLIFPFLGKPGHKGKLVLNTVATLMKSEKTISFLIKNRAFIDFINPSFTKVSNDEIESSLKFAFHEKHTIGKIKKQYKLDPSILNKTVAFCCPRDTWCKQKYLSQAGININKIDTSHDFVVEAKQRKLMNQELFRNINS